jgi:hypothetical protein
MSAMSAGEAVTMFKDVVLACAAFVGMLVAVSGLTTWNRQLKGGVEYELTRRLLRCTYNLREAIKDVRDPVVFIEEMVLSDEQSKFSEREKRHAGLANAYKVRRNKVTVRHAELHAELLEAEVVWDKRIHDSFQPLFDLQQELFSDIHLFVEMTDPSHSEESLASFRKIRASKRRVMYDLQGPLPDPFLEDIGKAILNIESYLKPHLAK